MDRFSKYKAITGALRNAVCELELVTRLTLPNGTTGRSDGRAPRVCKKARAAAT
jgi:hypothetical protein